MEWVFAWLETYELLRRARLNIRPVYFFVLIVYSETMLGNKACGVRIDSTIATRRIGCHSQRQRTSSVLLAPSNSYDVGSNAQQSRAERAIGALRAIEGELSGIVQGVAILMLAFVAIILL